MKGSVRILRATGPAPLALALACLTGGGQMPPMSTGWPRPQAPPGGTAGAATVAQEADVQVALGRVAERQGDFPRAMATYRAALERDRSRADACLRLAVLHDSQGQFNEAARWYRRALELAPGDPDVFCD